MRWAWYTVCSWFVRDGVLLQAAIAKARVAHRLVRIIVCPGSVRRMP
jgi:hypothetical protein